MTTCIFQSIDVYADDAATAGHEAVGTVVAVGRNVKSIAVGERIAADPMEPCRNCFYCIRGQTLLCENMTGYGGNGKLSIP